MVDLPPAMHASKVVELKVSVEGAIQIYHKGDTKLLGTIAS